MKTVLLLIALIAHVSSCFEKEAVAHTDSPLGAVCLSSQGVWHDGLLACRCEKGKVFTEQGCIHVELTNAMKDCIASALVHQSINDDVLDECFSEIYENLTVAVNRKNLSADETTQLLNALSDDAAYLLKGLTLPRNVRHTKLLIEFSKFDAEDLKSLYWVDFGAGTLASRVLLVKLNLNPGTLDRLTKVCSIRLVPIFGAASASQYCDDLVSGLLETSHLQSKSKFIENGLGCVPDCKRITFWDGLQSKMRLETTIHLREYLPFKRTISLHASDFDVRIYVNGLGNIEGIVAAKIELNANGAVVRRQLYAFDGQWNPLEASDRYSGDAATFANSLLEHQKHSSRMFMFPHENNWHDQSGEISLMLIDSGISVENPLFYGRLSIPSLPVDAQWAAGSLNEYVLINESESHGTQMASIMLKNLPDAKISSLSYWIHADTTTEKWIQEIRNSKAQIVNMSFSLAELGFDCDSFFESVFRALPDVLFVVAAGNTGTANPDSCPAKLGSNKRFENVLTVAGLGSNGLLDPQSSFGSGVAKIAAPYSAPCMKTEAPGDECHGTSVSAAIVSNWAARLMIRNPHLSASDVASAFQKSCIQTGWPIACGGPLDVKALDLGELAL